MSSHEGDFPLDAPGSPAAAAAHTPPRVPSPADPQDSIYRSGTPPPSYDIDQLTPRAPRPVPPVRPPPPRPGNILNVPAPPAAASHEHTPLPGSSEAGSPPNTNMFLPRLPEDPTMDILPPPYAFRAPHTKRAVPPADDRPVTIVIHDSSGRYAERALREQQQQQQQASSHQQDPGATYPRHPGRGEGFMDPHYGANPLLMAGVYHSRKRVRELHDWNQDICGCLNNIGSCLISCFCPCLALYSVGRYTKKLPLVYFIFLATALVLTSVVVGEFTCHLFQNYKICVIVVGVAVALALFRVLALCRLRGLVRRRYRIEGSAGEDCGYAMLCEPCALCQLRNEVAFEHPELALTDFL